MIDLAHLEKYRENNRLEAKRARGQVKQLRRRVEGE